MSEFDEFDDIEEVEEADDIEDVEGLEEDLGSDASLELEEDELNLLDIDFDKEINEVDEENIVEANETVDLDSNDVLDSLDINFDKELEEINERNMEEHEITDLNIENELESNDEIDSLNIDLDEEINTMNEEDDIDDYKITDIDRDNDLESNDELVSLDINSLKEIDETVEDDNVNVMAEEYNNDLTDNNEYDDKNIENVNEELSEDVESLKTNDDKVEYMYLGNNLKDNRIAVLSQDDMDGIANTMEEYDINPRNSFIHLDPNAELVRDDLDRPGFRKSVKEQLIDIQTDDEGILRDSKGRELDPEFTDVGHKNEYRKLKRLAESRNLSREEFIELNNDIDNLEIEDRSVNRSHQEEFKGGIREDLIINNPAIDRAIKKEIPHEQSDDELLNEMENIMRDDFKDENELVKNIENMGDDELFENLNNMEEELRKQEEFDSLTNQLSKEELEAVKRKIEAGDKDILKMFGIEEEKEENEGVTYIKKYPH